MHEMGIVFHLAKTLDSLVEEQNVTRIGSVTLEVGEVSGVVTDYFEDCWNYIKKKHPAFADSTLHVVTTRAVTYCEACGKTYGTVEHGRTCPYCQSGETYLLYGNEVIIKEIEAETADGIEGEVSAEAENLIK